MQCKIITSTGTAAVETAVNNWIDSEMNETNGIDIKYISMSENGSTMNVIIFYDNSWTRRIP